MLDLIHGIRRKYRFITREHLAESFIKTQPSKCSAGMLLMEKVCELDSYYVGCSGRVLLRTKVMWIDRQVDPLRSMGVFKCLTLRMWLSTLLFATSAK